MEIKMADNLYEALNCIFIELIKRGYKYIARDKNGALFAYSDKPTKRGKVWRLASIDGTSKDISLVSRMFTEIKWEDEKPFRIPYTNWKEVPRDTPVIYTSSNGRKYIQYFFKYDEANDRVVLYTAGRTSLTEQGIMEVHPERVSIYEQGEK